ncbi:MAG: tRNA (adenosine(37)-N6)-threonylcarbamoyltransferase complex dimerization subunit type 1 TsaB [Solirubrobacteraceae bacterium]
MIVLGFDTSTPATVVGLRLSQATTLQARDDPDGERRPGHATRLLPLASGLLVEAGVGWAEIGRIVVGVGPGTFTGLRIGVATARGLAQSLGVPLVGVSSLRALAHAASSGTAEAGVLAVIDARRSEVFAAAYDGDAELVAPFALVPAGIGELLERTSAQTEVERWVAVGDGATRYRDALQLAEVDIPEDHSPLHRIDACAICELGADPALHAPVGAIEVEPDYRRRPDAEIALEEAASR